jgi:O-antigen/teichoic acid export membrane protein
MILPLIANFIGKAVSALVLLLFTPLYVRWLGIESFGLVGFFQTLIALSILFDFGLSATLSREMARLSTSLERRHLLATYERVYLGIALLIGVFATFFTPSFDAKTIDPALLQKALLYMGLAVAMQAPFFLYLNGLMGLQRQVLQSSLTASFSLVRALATTLVLHFFAPTIENFFLCQMAVGALQSLVSRAFLLRSLPCLERGHFDFQLLKKQRRFALGMSGISVTGLILTQADKLLLSHILSMEMFGYFCLALVVANGLNTLGTSLHTVAFPHFSERIAKKEEFTPLYHKCCQIMALMVMPLAVMIALFSSELLLLWTGSPEAALHSATLLSLLVTAALFYTSTLVPYALSLAHGEPKPFFALNLVSIALFFPLMLLLIPSFPAFGACTLSLGTNLAYLFVAVPLVHRRLPKEERRRWWREDIALPLCGALAFPLLGKALFPPTLFFLGLTALVSFLGTLLCSSHVRPARLLIRHS